VGQALLDPIAVETDFVEQCRAGAAQIAFSKSTSSQVAWISSLLRTSVSRIMRSANLMVG
jgi:hypothetical protein